MAPDHWLANRDERGASLLLVLVFITALSLVISALLFGSSTSQKTTVTTTALAKAAYATDSGVEYVLEQLRSNGGFCPALSGSLIIRDGKFLADTVESATAAFQMSDVGVRISGGNLSASATVIRFLSADKIQISEAPGDAVGLELEVHRPAAIGLPAGFAPGQNLSVTCSGDDAEVTPQTLSGWAVVTLGKGEDSLGTRNGVGGEVPKQISGPTYVGGKFRLQAPIQANQTAPNPIDDPLTFPSGKGDGLVLQSVNADGGCNPAGPSGLTANFQCAAATFPAPDLKPSLPTPVPADAPTWKDAGSGATACRIFHPGRYRNVASLQLANNNYLASGTYYFENLGTIDLGSKTVFGGAIDTGAGGRSALNPPLVPCGTDGQASPAVTSGDKGVQIILGGNTRLDIKNAKAEFMAYHPKNINSPGAGISLRTVSPQLDGTIPTGYVPWNTNGSGPPDPTERALIVDNGTNPEFAVHGVVYMPNASIELFASNTSEAAVLGGITAYNLLLQASANGQGLRVQIAGSRPQSRSNVIVEGRVPVSGTKTVMSRAVVDVRVSRKVTDGVTYGSKVVESATADFSKADEGLPILVGSTPATIDQFINATTVRVSTNVGPGSSVVLDIDPPLKRSIAGCSTAAGQPNVTCPAGANFNGADVGATITGFNMAGGAKILDAPDETNLILTANATGGGSTTLTITQRKIVRVTVNSWRVDNL